jgi:hypothetical protein
MFHGRERKIKETAMLTALIVFPVLLVLLGFEAAFRIRR